jgi:hypothetical protein
MLCPNCGKESSNLRICAFCQTPYPISGPGAAPTPRFTRSVPTPRASKAIPSRQAGDPRIAIARRSRVRRWVAIGLLATFTVVYYFLEREPAIPVGVALPNLIAAPMSPTDAAGELKSVGATAQVQEHAGALTVRISAATFPQRRIGQLALAQQYARADEIVQGHKRAITFLDPDGNPFAKADPEKGVMMTH